MSAIRLKEWPLPSARIRSAEATTSLNSSTEEGRWVRRALKTVLPAQFFAGAPEVVMGAPEGVEAPGACGNVGFERGTNVGIETSGYAYEPNMRLETRRLRRPPL
ncbi:hypothetical protein GCM10012287_06190 [Streptomyces daqingensis]|uniref:Uncharacterized protein n=1 Tax=Streptomyces daqingensis TaxID=1472640 RepID=A0ABQ2LUP0_9ACTN|nr:hypothetical protein GCM10012287_06190 [Streptomyces daqingensis]